MLTIKELIKQSEAIQETYGDNTTATTYAGDVISFLKQLECYQDHPKAEETS